MTGDLGRECRTCRKIQSKILKTTGGRKLGVESKNGNEVEKQIQKQTGFWPVLQIITDREVMDTE